MNQNASEADADSPWPALLLSFVGGYVDTFSYVMLFGLFTAHVTGNFVTMGAALASQAHAGLLGKLLALPVFILAVGATRWLQHRGAVGLPRTLVLIQLAGLVVFMLCGLVAGPPGTADAPAAIVPGLMGVAAMAIQNTLARSSFAGLGQTTVMTGNVVQATMNLVDLLLGDGERHTIIARTARLWPPIVAFGIGAVGAGLSCGPLGDWALLLPEFALLLLWQRIRAASAAH